MSKFVPHNRYVLIERIEKEQEKSQVLVPDDYIKEEPHGLYKILSLSRDSQCPSSAGSLVAVENSMVQEINVTDDKYLVVLENYILGAIK